MGLYYINNKFYILVSSYYREVTVEKNGDDYNVVPIKESKKIEDTKMTGPIFSITVEEAYNKIAKSNNRNKID